MWFMVFGTIVDNQGKKTLPTQQLSPVGPRIPLYLYVSSLSFLHNVFEITCL